MDGYFLGEPGTVKLRQGEALMSTCKVCYY